MVFDEIDFLCGLVKNGEPITVGTAIVGRNKKILGKLGVVEQVSGRGHSKRFVIKWRDSSTTTESSRGICLPSVFEESRRFVEARGNKWRTESEEEVMDMQSASTDGDSDEESDESCAEQVEEVPRLVPCAN